MSVLINVLVHTHESYRDVVRTRDLATLRSLLQDRRAADGSPAVFALERAIEVGFDDVVEVYLDEGTSVDVRGDLSSTPLMWAAAVGRLALVNRLLGAGANVNAVDLAGMTPLLYAAHGQALEVVQVLLSAGADLRHRNHDGQSALDLARLRPFSLKIPGLPVGWGVRRTIRDSATARLIARELRKVEE